MVEASSGEETIEETLVVLVIVRIIAKISYLLRTTNTMVSTGREMVRTREIEEIFTGQKDTP